MTRDFDEADPVEPDAASHSRPDDAVDHDWSSHDDSAGNPERAEDAAYSRDDVAEPVAQIVRPVRRGHPIIAWLVVIGVTGFSVVVTQLQHSNPDANESEKIQLALLEMQARYFVGAAELSGPSKGQLADQARLFYRGSLRERLAATILLGDLAGPKAALEQLQSLDEALAESNIVLTEDERSLLDSLTEIYASYADEDWEVDSITADQRALIDEELGWFANLALMPAQGESAERIALVQRSRRTAMIAVGVMMAMIFLGLMGLVSFVVFIAALAGGKLNSGLKWSNNGRLYIEAFAAWMLAFLGFSIVVPFFVSGEGNPVLPQYFVGGLSLLAVFWPVIRGVRWSEVRRDIGWFGGSQWYIEPVCGFLVYIATLPVLALALLLFVAFSGIPLAAIDLQPSQMPAHPILLWVRDASGWERMHVFFLACVSAPVIEETMFRGFLYRHLREASAGFRMSISITFSALFNGLIFAVIHPQGLLAVPALTALAVGFSLAREWRGSLIAPMTAHALNNSIVTMLLLTMM